MIKIKFLKLIVLVLFLAGSDLFALTETFIDRFNSVSYNNNDGTKNFAGPWDEYEPYATNNDPSGGYIRISSNRLYLSYIWAETITRELDLSGASAVTLSIDLVSNNLAGDTEEIQLKNSDGAWETVIFVDENTVTGTKNYTLPSRFIHASSGIKLIATTNWNSSDNVYWDNLVFTATYVDTDGDSVLDSVDVDDDNDGIFDVDEKSVQTDSYSNGDGGGTHIYSYAYTDRSTVSIDIMAVNHAFNIEIDGTTLLVNGNIMDIDNTAGRSQLKFATSGGGSGTIVNNPENTNTNGLPRVRIYIDANGVVKVYGTRTTSSTFIESLITADGSTYNTFVPSSGSHEIKVTNINDAATETLNAKNTVATDVDSDGDGIVNSLDLDSDNDGLADNVEAQSTGGFVLSSTPPSIRPDGSNSAYPAAGLTPPDTDVNGIMDFLDNDSDDDEITDCKEGNVNVMGSCPIVTVEANGMNINAGGAGNYNAVAGNITNPDPVAAQTDDEISSDGEAAYREAACGPAEVSLTANQWKTFSFPCDTGINSIETLLGDTLGVYGDNADWVMYKQNANYTGKPSSDFTLMNASDTVTAGTGYWIITNANKVAKIKRPLGGIAKSATVPASNFAGIPTSGQAFSEVMAYQLPASSTTDAKKVLIGNPFLKKFQLSDLYYQNDAKSLNYVSTTTLVSGEPMEPVVYIKDSSDITSGNYIAITPGTPGLGDIVPAMQGFWIKLNLGNSNSNTITFPYEK